MQGIPASTSIATPPFAVLGRHVVASHQAEGGYTPGWRGVLTLDDGSTAFVKMGGASVRREALVLGFLEQQGGFPFAPRLLDFIDGEVSTLVLEDLSSAYWPTPYPADLEPLFAALDEVGKVDAPPDLDALEDWDDGRSSRWARVAADPAAFLSLGVCSAEWLEANVGALIEAEECVDLSGTKLVHNDVHSGNVCFPDGRAVLTDWATAARGNPDLDVAFAIVSVRAEGGRLPRRRLLEDEGAWSARLAGHNAVEASSPMPDWAEPGSTLRLEQLEDLRVALPWAARASGLEPPR